jgi:hypothetical protein
VSRPAAAEPGEVRGQLQQHDFSVHEQRVGVQQRELSRSARIRGSQHQFANHRRERRQGGVSLSLSQFTGVNSEPYINACSTDPSQSAILCNLAGSCPPAMPVAGDGVTPTVPASPESIENLKTWLACGAPFN